MLRRLYDWTLALAARPSAPYALGAVSFSESSFFPVPPDVMLVPMMLARPDRAWRYGAICTVTSVLGGVFGYLIGALTYDTIGLWLIELYGLSDKVSLFRSWYEEYGSWVILLGGLTPLPYKLVTIMSGLAGYNLLWFILLSVFARGARFFFIALLMSQFGPAIKALIDRHFNLLAALSVALFIGGFAAVKFLL
ncbi:YqaA family protein [Microvirga splendida]|uniref:DedA family protein n=1 Tax=Microvirga splendida TaxID=2795727 RepID=A0ABS0Y421_9HYPH|nr:YqaA family protein [Microvirga splendida]MBJ6127043.1 DedA family protein [Microvirga splendida]